VVFAGDRSSAGSVNTRKRGRAVPIGKKVAILLVCINVRAACLPSRHQKWELKHDSAHGYFSRERNKIAFWKSSSISLWTNNKGSNAPTFLSTTHLPNMDPRMSLFGESVELFCSERRCRSLQLTSPTRTRCPCLMCARQRSLHRLAHIVGRLFEL
jgi:hypothetical protein